MNESELKNWIKKCEAYKSKPYYDTVGKITIGYGRNLADNGITREEGDFLFENDFRRSVNELETQEWYRPLPVPVKQALINMNFNLGLPRLLGFKKMIAALTAKDFKKAAKEALDSKWAQQVGLRAQRIAYLIKQGSNESGADRTH